MNFFQTVHFSAVKFTTGNKKNNEFSSDTKISESLKKSEAIGPGTFKNENFDQFWKNQTFQ